MIRRVHRVVLNGRILVIDRGDICPVRDTIGDVRGIYFAGFDHEITRHGIKAETARAHFDFGMGRCDNVGKAHDGNSSPTFFRREEAPIANHVARKRVRNIIRGECEAVDSKQHLPGCKLGGLGFFNKFGGMPVVSVHEKVEVICGHRCSFCEGAGSIVSTQRMSILTNLVSTNNQHGRSLGHHDNSGNARFANPGEFQSAN